MKEAFHYLDTVEIHAFSFDGDVDGGSDGCAIIGQEGPTGSTP